MSSLYDDLYEAWKREKTESEIQPLAKDFYDRIAEYTKKLKESQRMLDEKTLKARLLRRELDNLRRLSKELVETRLGKILQISVVGGKVVPSLLLAKREEHFFEMMIDASNQFMKTGKNTHEGREFETFEKIKKPQTILVRFVCEIPAIIGVDMKTYGPFRTEDVASLPAENAKALIQQSVALEIEIRKK